MKNKKHQFNRYLGAVHIHTKFSDGTGELKEICRAAKKAGLDWIIITDHNNMDIEEGFIDGICVIKGEEISPLCSNHYLALGINEVISPDLNPNDYVQAVRNQGGFGYAAHPDESDKRKNSNKPINWLDKSIKPDGIELWNWFSNWADNLCDKNIFTLIYAYFFRHKLVTKPKSETLNWWDELNKESEKIIPAIGGVDAHALKFNKYLVPVLIFPYKDMFETVTNVTYLDTKLSNEFKIAKKQISDALKEGKNLIINRKVCKQIPEININNLKKIVHIGNFIYYDNNTCINIKLKKVFEVSIFCDGELIFNKKIKKIKIPIHKKGKYRVEIGLNKLGYAYSNPIIVK